ncbi:TadE/TadG family type IV pilus assembly protein [Streptomyces sp. B1866]|uniref:TadE/TadG family type IV pilus assembly protein n=1 Tax=Streptomyces sp. B1866 TaxID=3075431 RepID=UPI0028923843|nr:TadE/TadG family type IV pilus assembly protein [Streptomyces sp. B1866]MDT3397020.1 TadE/TadG family type IV pilus assembly protein [Streptomyces sp. B1866]
MTVGRTVRAVRRGARDRGQVSVELIGFVPLLLLVGLAVIQLGLAAYAAQQAGTAARAAARTAALDKARTSPAQAGYAAMSDWVARRADVDASGPCQGGGEVTATVTVHLPSVIPGAHFGTARRSATMPCAHDWELLPPAGAD